MKSTMKWLTLAIFCTFTSIAFAQVPENVTVNNNDDFPDFTKLGGNTNTTPAKPATSNPSSTTPLPSTPSSTPTPATSTVPTGADGKPLKIEPAENTAGIPPDTDAPLDGIVENKTILEKVVLPWEPVRESDIMWRRRIWRVIDVREKINLPFVNREENFFSILMKGIQDSVIRAYKGDNDKFHYKLTPQEVSSIGSSVDTIEQVDPTTYETKLKIIVNKLDPEQIRRYRIKEEWFFDKQYSTLKVRILGIAPLKEERDPTTGQFLWEMPLFWIRYPDCREYLARHQVFIDGNDANPMSWEDLFELRRFSSYVSKESNVHGRRLQDYLQGIDILLEGEKIKSELFNTEHDFWSF
jgi:gliding motility associated protien GldN